MAVIAPVHHRGMSILSPLVISYSTSHLSGRHNKSKKKGMKIMEFGSELCMLDLGRGMFGNPVIGLHCYESGVILNRKKTDIKIHFRDVKKVSVYNYEAPNAPNFPTTIVMHDGEKHKFILDKNRGFYDCTQAKALLSVHANYLLGPHFPANLLDVTVDIGGMGIPMLFEKGRIRLGEETYPYSELLSCELNRSGILSFKVRGVKRLLGFRSQDSENIIATMRMFEEILKRNSQHGVDLSRNQWFYDRLA